MPEGPGYDISRWVNGYSVLTLFRVSRDHIPNAMTRIIKICAGAEVVVSLVCSCPPAVRDRLPSF